MGLGTMTCPAGAEVTGCCAFGTMPAPCCICPKHPDNRCEDHDYIYVRGERRRECANCGQEPPMDWHDYMDEES